MKNLSAVLIFVIILVLFGCSTESPINSELEKMAEKYKDRYFRSHPVAATQHGFHRYDSFLPIVSADSIIAYGRWLKRFNSRLKKLNQKKMDPQEVIDVNILQLGVNSQIFEIDSLQNWLDNPMYYVNILGSGFYSLIARDFAPEQERMLSFMNRLEQVELFVNDVKKNLEHPPKIYTETAIAQLKGVRNLVEQQMAFGRTKNITFDNAFNLAAQKALESIDDLHDFFQNELLPQSTGDFRLGERLYSKKLIMTLEVNPNFNRKTLINDATNYLARVTSEMYTIAKPLYEQRKKSKIKKDQETAEFKHEVIKFVLDRMAKNSTYSKGLIETCQNYLKQTTEYVENNNLVALPAEPVEIVEVPEFMRGVAVAYCDAPGAYDTGQKTFYMIAPLPDKWSEAQKESYLREYNKYQLQDLTIHEAMPGHYVQLTYPQNYNSTIRKLFSSGVFVEGWAVYAEQMMIDHGYGGEDNAYLKLAQRKMLLRVIINSILDQKIHTENMTHDEAIALMTVSGFQELSEAEGKWRRACLTSTQLSTYFYGYREMMNLSKLYEQRHKDSFNLREFHDAVLSGGAIPLVYLKQVVLRDIKG